MRTSTSARRLTSMSAVVSLVAAGLFAIAFGGASPAAALLPGPAPIVEPGANNATADALPTVQIDGVVWSQAIVGNKVYAGGDFANARPAGAAAGTNEVPRSDLLAYDVTTGVLDPSFAPTFNGQVKTVVASPDGSRVYVGGDFTQVNGVTRDRLAAFDTTTGALVPQISALLDYTVNSIVATASTVYVAGAFSNVGGIDRTRLAAFDATTGALLAWAPTADATIRAIVMTPSGSKIIAGGAFANINGSAAYGLGAIDAVNGNLVPWAANNLVRNAGSAAAITSLETDGTNIYGTGYVFGAGGNLEGTFAADPESGTVKWIEDCHGDTYDAYPVNGVIYTVSHDHYCGNIGGFPQTDPWTFHHALAFTTDAVGTVAHNGTGNYFDWYGNAAPAMYNWFPDMQTGTFTGQNQAAFNVTGNGQYVVLGGEFPSVNYTAQQGLVRFALRPPAPGKQGPRLTAAKFVPTVNATSSHTARITWQANWDRDSENLTYKLIRDNAALSPIYTTTAVSQFWNQPVLGYLDAGLTPGATYNYKVYAYDSFGNVGQGSNVSITMPLTDPSPYVQQVLNDGPGNYWRLGEPNGTTGVDLVGGNNLIEGSGVGHGASGAITGDSDKAVTTNGSSTGTGGTNTTVQAPSTFSIEAFVKTSGLFGGKIVGFGTSRSGNSATYDRHIYMDNSGHLIFGVYPGAYKILTSPGTYRNNAWHHVVGTLSSAGMALYVDGARVAFDASTTTAQIYSGYWRIGGDNLAKWPSRPLRDNFSGSIDDVSVYRYALTPTQVLAHYRGSLGIPNQTPTATFSSSCSVVTCAFDASGSSDTDGTVNNYAWNFGDGATATGATTSHAYAGTGTFTVTLTVTDNQGGTNTTTRTVSVAAPNKPPVAAFTPTCGGLTCSFNGSASSDPDGTVAGYAWDFGDGSTDSGATTSHTYAAGGTYTVSLTVTDNQGGTNTATGSVVVSASVFASDSFARSTASGWGTSDVGGPWLVGNGAPSQAGNYSVSSGAGQILMPAPGAQPSAYLNGVSVGDSDSSVDFTLDKAQTSTSSTYVYLSARHSGTSQYRLRFKQPGTGAVQLSLTKVVAGSETVLLIQTLSGLTFTPGQYLRMKFRVSGTASTTLSGKVWTVGSAEPATWQVTTTDASPLGPGGPGVQLFLSSVSTNAPVTAFFQNLTVGPVTGP